MEGLLKLSTAVNITILMIDSSDHITGKTGLSAGLTIYATKAAGTPATITPTVTELDATNVKGVYKLALTTTHTNTLGELQLHITATGADPTDVKWQVCTDLPGDTVSSVTGAVGSVTGAVGSVTGNVGGNVVGSVASVTGAVGSVTGAVGSVTGNVGGNVVGSVASVTARVTANTDQLAGQTVTAAAGVTFPTSVASPTNITAGTITTVTNLTNAPTAGDFTATMKTSLVTAAWDTAIAGHVTAGSTGAALNAAGSAGDPWATLIPGAYGAGTAGNIVGTNLDATVSSRLASASISLAAGAVTVGTNNDKTGYALTSAYDFAKGTTAMTESYATNAGTMTPVQALHMIWSVFRGRAISGTTLTATKLDNSTTSMTFTLDSATTPTSQIRAS